VSANGITGRAAATYIEQQVLNESPLARVARLYDMTAVEIARARAALGTGNLAAKGLAVQRATRTIGVLHASLDMERGGDVARNLDRLYAYCQRRLAEAHARNDDRAFAEIAGYVAALGSAWREIASRPVAPLEAPAPTPALAASAAR
jgi:flagellar protein FliS